VQSTDQGRFPYGRNHPNLCYRSLSTGLRHGIMALYMGQGTTQGQPKNRDDRRIHPKRRQHILAPRICHSGSFRPHHLVVDLVVHPHSDLERGNRQPHHGALVPCRDRVLGFGRPSRYPSGHHRQPQVGCRRPEWHQERILGWIPGRGRHGHGGSRHQSAGGDGRVHAYQGCDRNLGL